MDPFPPASNPPPPPPKIRHGLLWISLVIPSVVAAVGAPIFFVYNVVITMLAIIVGWAMFSESLSGSYAGRSATFLGFGYFIGQFMVCLVAGLGACVLQWSRGFR